MSYLAVSHVKVYLKPSSLEPPRQSCQLFFFLYSTSCSCLWVNKEEATGRHHFTFMDRFKSYYQMIERDQKTLNYYCISSGIIESYYERILFRCVLSYNQKVNLT